MRCWDQSCASREEQEYFESEDRCVALDVAIASNASCLHTLRGMANQLAEDGGEARLNLPASFDVLHARSIRALYGESGQEVVDVLRKNPASTLPIVLARLQQKDEEWRRARLELSAQRLAVAERLAVASVDVTSSLGRQHAAERCAPRKLVSDLHREHEAIAQKEVGSPAKSQGGSGSFCAPAVTMDLGEPRTEVQHVLLAAITKIGPRVLRNGEERDRVHTLWMQHLLPFLEIGPPPSSFITLTSEPAFMAGSPMPQTPVHSARLFMPELKMDEAPDSTSGILSFALVGKEEPGGSAGAAPVKAEPEDDTLSQVSGEGELDVEPEAEAAGGKKGAKKPPPKKKGKRKGPVKRKAPIKKVETIAEVMPMDTGVETVVAPSATDTLAAAEEGANAMLADPAGEDTEDLPPGSLALIPSLITTSNTNPNRSIAPISSPMHVPHTPPLRHMLHSPQLVTLTTWKLKQEMATEGGSGKVLYANEHIYTFFRVLNLVHERLCFARKALPGRIKGGEWGVWLQLLDEQLLEAVSAPTADSTVKARLQALLSPETYKGLLGLDHMVLTLMRLAAELVASEKCVQVLEVFRKHQDLQVAKQMGSPPSPSKSRSKPRYADVVRQVLDDPHVVRLHLEPGARCLRAALPRDVRPLLKLREEQEKHKIQWNRYKREYLLLFPDLADASASVRPFQLRVLAKAKAAAAKEISPEQAEVSVPKEGQEQEGGLFTAEAMDQDDSEAGGTAPHDAPLKQDFSRYAEGPLRPLSFFRDGRRNLAKRLLASVSPNEPSVATTTITTTTTTTTTTATTTATVVKPSSPVKVKASEADEVALRKFQEQALALFARQAAVRKEHGAKGRRSGQTRWETVHSRLLAGC
jgi:hypothetical protein